MTRADCSATRRTIHTLPPRSPSRRDATRSTACGGSWTGSELAAVARLRKTARFAKCQKPLQHVWKLALIRLSFCWRRHLALARQAKTASSPGHRRSLGYAGRGREGSWNFTKMTLRRSEPRSAAHADHRDVPPRRRGLPPRTRGTRSKALRRERRFGRGSRASRTTSKRPAPAESNDSDEGNRAHARTRT